MKPKVCVGCGSILQSLDPSMPGYVPSNLEIESEEDVLCQRCFKLKHYNENTSIKIDEQEFLKSLDIKTDKNIILYVVDIFNLHGSLIKDLNKYKDNSKIYIIVNKVDVLPKSLKSSKLMNYLERVFKDNGIYYDKILLVSAAKNYNFDALQDLITYTPNYNNIYFVGNANVGKSSIINKLLHNYSNDSKDYVTTSLYPGTTLKFIKIPYINGKIIYDTPGLFNHSNITHHIDNKNLKYLLPKKEIKPLVFQLNPNQSLILGSLARVDFVNCNKKTPVIVYANAQVYIHRSKLDEKSNDKFDKFMLDKSFIPKAKDLKSFTDLAKTSFEIKKENKQTISISGLAMIDVKCSGAVINVYAPKKVKISLNDSYFGGVSNVNR